MKRIALVIAGGSGERFWPLSSKQRPKQLLRISGSGRVMLEDTVLRLQSIFGIENVFIVTSRALVEAIQNEVPELAAHIIAEPEKRNTAGAIVWGIGVVTALLDTTDLTFAVFPSDHVVRPDSKFQESVNEALVFAEEDKRLVTIGVRPTRPETGYGYIEKGKTVRKKSSNVARFIEKPDAETAQNMIDTGKVFWNSGVFVWTLDTVRAELARASAVHAKALEEIISSVKAGQTAVAEIAFRELPNISIDNALMERSDKVGVVEASYEWDDIGAWDALERVIDLDDRGNAITGSALAVDASGCIVHNSNPDQIVKLLGVHDLVVVSTPEAILVCPKDQAQQVKRLATEE